MLRYAFRPNSNFMANNQNSVIKGIILFLGVAIIVLLGWIMFFQKPNKTPAAIAPQKTEKKPSVSSSNIPQAVKTSEKEDLLKTVFKDIPHFEQTEKVDFYTLQYPDSTKMQDVYQFYSKKSMDEALAFYQDWAKKNGWSEANVVKENNLFSLYLIKSEEKLVVKISKENNKVKVNLDLLR